MPASAARGPGSAEPVSPEPAREVPGALLTQSWLDVSFLHWSANPTDVAALLPAGTVPDTHEGLTYVGLVAFRMHRAGLLTAPGIPYLGSFPETNVRLYCVDGEGRRGVVFLSLEASRLLPVAIARSVFRLPYMWARMAVHPDRDTISYTSRRRWPGPRGACSRIAVRIGEPVHEPAPLEHFLTARWGLHNNVHGQTVYLPTTHPCWPLHRAELLHCDEELITATGLPAPVGPPVSVLYAPGVRARFGRPTTVRNHAPTPPN
ncbi:DUF2071 domain-containing protein [Streptomyces sp. NPDC001817]|uniref:YqjF family protein n=1 Tax=Streptomyces sp. NPDC001817 TaxID=3154398 RepID=UPI003331CB10